MVVFWGIISWTIVTILRYLDARDRRRSQEQFNSGSDQLPASDVIGDGSLAVHLGDDTQAASEPVATLGSG
jgi:hypothetical protein